MKVKFAKGVYLKIKVTDKMAADYNKCQERIKKKESISCEKCGCSLDVDIFGMGLCELPTVVKKIKK